MARGPNEKAEKAKKLYKKGMKLVDIAEKLNVPDGTVRRWKSTYRWDGEQESERSDKKANVRNNKKPNKKEAVADEVKDVMQNDDLTDKQRLFCLYYIRCFNATKAYQKAYGCSYESAMQNGSRLLRNEKVKSEIIRLKQERLNREFFSAEDVFQRYMDIAFADMNDYVEIKNNGIRFKDSSSFDGTLIKKVSSGKVDSIEMLDAMQALKWLSDHMDIATEEQKAKIAVLRAKVETDSNADNVDDGFIDALNASAGEDWSDEDNEI